MQHAYCIERCLRVWLLARLIVSACEHMYCRHVRSYSLVRINLNGSCLKQIGLHGSGAIYKQHTLYRTSPTL